MKKIIGAIILLIGVIVVQAQETKERYIRKGLIRSMGTISTGIMLKENISTISLHGCLEYYVADNISLRGDSYFFLKAKDNSGNNPFDFNHSTFSGASYHFKTKNHFDPYIALEPGVSITRLSSYSALIEPLIYSPNEGWTTFQEKTTVNPLISSAFGFNLYFQKLFHLFAEARYIYGKHISNGNFSPISLSELRFSFGLGINLNLLKKKS